MVGRFLTAVELVQIWKTLAANDLLMDVTQALALPILSQITVVWNSNNSPKDQW